MDRRPFTIVARMRSRTWSLAASALLAIGVLGTLWWASQRSPGPSQAAFARAMATARVERRPVVEERVVLTGEIQAVRALKIVVPRTESWQVAIKWLAEDGAEVKAGDPIVELDNSSLATAIEGKRLGVQEAQIALETREHALSAQRQKKQLEVERARLEVDKAQLDAAVPQELRSRREWNEMQSTMQEKEVALKVAQKQLAQAEVADRAEIANLRLALEKAQRELATAEASLQGLSARAPRDGVVIIESYFQRWLEDRKYQIGDVVYPGLVVASMPDLSEMEVVAWLPDVDDGKVAQGMPARCVLDTYPERAFSGRVAAVGVVAQQQADSSSFRVRVALDKAAPALMRPGMSVRVEVARRTWHDALVLPRGAIAWEKGQAHVLTADGHTRTLQLAGCTPTECVVEQGAEEGTRVRL